MSCGSLRQPPFSCVMSVGTCYKPISYSSPTSFVSCNSTMACSLSARTCVLMLLPKLKDPAYAGLPLLTILLSDCMGPVMSWPPRGVVRPERLQEESQSYIYIVWGSPLCSLVATLHIMHSSGLSILYVVPYQPCMHGAIS